MPGAAQSQVEVTPTPISKQRSVSSHECAWLITFSPEHNLAELNCDDHITVKSTLIDQCREGKLTNPFPNTAHFVVLDSHGIVNRKAFHEVRKNLAHALNCHIQSGGRVIVRTHSKHDSFNHFAKWNEFTKIAPGVYINYPIDQTTHSQHKLYLQWKLSLPSDPVLFSVEDTVLSTTDSDNAQWLKVLTSYVSLYDLGDHADEAIAKASLLRRKAEPIEEIYEDCGEDISAIELPAETITEAFFDIELEDEEHEEPNYFEQMHEMFSWYFVGSDGFEGKHTPTHMPNANVFTSFSEAYVALNTTGTSIDVMELFGGEGGVTRIAVRRNLKSGGNLDIVSGYDLSSTAEQNLLFAYIRKFKPLCIVMAPPCTAFGSWSNYNRVHAYNAWHASCKQGKALLFRGPCLL